MNSSDFFKQGFQADSENYWLSVSDLMAGLMIIFLFIAVSYMRMVLIERDKVIVERDKIKSVIVAWEETQDSVYTALTDEFQYDLEKWQAEIDRETLAVRFKEPEVLFGRGKTKITSRFKIILDDFFPRYIKRLNEFSNCTPRSDDVPRGCIEEIRIEGHTSSEWDDETTDIEAYFNNMWLSQERTRSVLKYCYTKEHLSEKYIWLPQRLVGVGFSSSRPIYDLNNLENKNLSRRVEFRVRTTVEKQLMQIIKE